MENCLLESGDAITLKGKLFRSILALPKKEKDAYKLDVVCGWKIVKDLWIRNFPDLLSLTAKQFADKFKA